MTPEEFEASLHRPTRDGRTYARVEKAADLLSGKNQMIRAKKRDGKCLAGLPDLRQQVGAA